MENSLNRHRRGEEQPDADRFRTLRQWLNIAFMVGAVAGVLVYFQYDPTRGTWVILAAMVLKMVECVLRLLK